MLTFAVVGIASSTGALQGWFLRRYQRQQGNDGSTAVCFLWFYALMYGANAVVWLVKFPEDPQATFYVSLAAMFVGTLMGYHGCRRVESFTQENNQTQDEEGALYGDAPEAPSAGRRET